MNFSPRKIVATVVLLLLARWIGNTRMEISEEARIIHYACESPSAVVAKSASLELRLFRTGRDGGMKMWCKVDNALRLLEEASRRGIGDENIFIYSDSDTSLDVDALLTETDCRVPTFPRHGDQQLEHVKTNFFCFRNSMRSQYFFKEWAQYINNTGTLNLGTMDQSAVNKIATCDSRKVKCISSRSELGHCSRSTRARRGDCIASLKRHAAISRLLRHTMTAFQCIHDNYWILALGLLSATGSTHAIPVPVAGALQSMGTGAVSVYALLKHHILTWKQGDKAFDPTSLIGDAYMLVPEPLYGGSVLRFEKSGLQWFVTPFGVVRDVTFASQKFQVKAIALLLLLIILASLSGRLFLPLSPDYLIAYSQAGKAREEDITFNEPVSMAISRNRKPLSKGYADGIRKLWRLSLNKYRNKMY